MKPQSPPRAGACRLALVACALTLAACGGSADPAADGPAASLTITAESPARQALDRALVVSGSVAAWQEVSLGVELTGIRVAEVRVEVGDRVRKGQALVRLDARTLDVQARQADAALAQADANLALARAEAERGKRLRDEKLISASDADQLTANLLKAEAQRTTAEADREAARLRLGFATVVAPEAGIIANRSVQPGQIVNAGTELLRLIRDGRLEWRAELAEKDLPRVSQGTVVELTGPTGEPVRGRVRAVAPGLDPETRTGLVYADLPEAGTLRAGMFAQGRIVLGTTPAMVLPREAVVYRDGLPYVFVVVPPGNGTGKKGPGPERTAPVEAGGGERVVIVQQRRITVGIQQGNFTEVSGGLADGEQVAVRGAGFLSDGDTVRIAAAGTALAAQPPANPSADAGPDRPLTGAKP